MPERWAWSASLRGGAVRRRTPEEEALRARDRQPGIGGFRRFSLSLSLLIVVLLVGLKWSWIDGQARAVVVLSSILETPRLTPAVEAVTGEPRFAEASVAGNPAFVVKPRGEGPWSVLFFVNGVVTEGRKLPEVRRVAEG
jgi:hypothetical protein